MQAGVRRQRWSATLGALGLGLAVAWPAFAANRPPPDPSAIRDAVGRASEPGDSYVSARSLAHFLAAAVAREQGDDAQVIAELKLAALYDTSHPYPHYALACEYLRRGQLDLAAESAQDALVLDRAHVPSLILLGRVLLAEGESDRAVDVLRRAARADPSLTEPFGLLVRAHLARHELPAALAVLDRLDALAKVAPPGASSEQNVQARAAVALSEMADALAQEGNDAQAEALFRRACERDPGNAQRVLQLAHFYEGRGRTREAADSYARALGLSNLDPQLASTTARLYLDAGQTGAAAAYIPLIAAADDAQARHADDALVQLGAALLQKGAGVEAAQAFEAAALIAPDRGEIRFYAGAAYEQAGQLARALQSYRLVADGCSVAVQAHARAAYLAHRQGDRAGADLLKALVRDHPDSSEAASLLAVVLDELGLPADGVTLVEPLYRARPSGQLAVALARLYVREGDAQRAIGVLDDQLRRTPGDTQLAYARATALEAAGAHGEAVAQGRALLARAPENHDAMNFLAYVLAVSNTQLDEAEQLVRRALSHEPTRAEYLDTLGFLLVRRGRAAEACPVLERAAEGAPSSAEIAVHLAEALAKCGRGAEAKAAYERALALARAQKNQAVRASVEAGLGQLAQSAPAATSAP